MREVISHLESAIQQVMTLLRSGEPITPKEQAIVTSLTWHLLAALHSRRSQEIGQESGRESSSVKSHLPPEGKSPFSPRKDS
jgi:hypothetical protein